MIANRQYIADLLKERKRYATVFTIEDSRVVYNPLIKYHIEGIKKKKHTLKPA